MTDAARITRLRFAAIAGGALAPVGFWQACRRGSEAREADDGRLAARPGENLKTSARGERALGLGRARDAILRLPTPAVEVPLPLFVLLHGAGGSGAGMLRRLGSAP